MKDKLKTAGKWFLGFAFVASLFAALSNKHFVSALIWVAMTAVLFLPREKIKEKLKVDLSNKGKAIIIFIGFIAAASFDPSATSAPTQVNQPSQANTAEVKQVSKPIEQQNNKQTELSAADKKALQEFYKKFADVPSNADKQYDLWSKSLTDGSSPATAYLNADVIINLNDKVRTDVRKLQSPAFLNEGDKEKIKEAITNLSTAYYTRNEALEQAKKYLNTQDLEALSKFKEKINLSSSFSMSAIASLMEVMTNNKVDFPSL